MYEPPPLIVVLIVSLTLGGIAGFILFPPAGVVLLGLAFLLLAGIAYIGTTGM